MLKKVLFSVGVLFMLSGCGTKDEVIEEEYVPQVGFRREKGDRLEDETVDGEDWKIKRLITQYETIDRPIIVNSLKEIEVFMASKDGYRDRVYLDSNMPDDVLIENKQKALTQLGYELVGNVDYVKFITYPYPLPDTKYYSYYSNLIGLLNKSIEDLKNSYNLVYNIYQNPNEISIENRGVGVLEQSIKKADSRTESMVLYLKDIDKNINEMREELGMDTVEYTYNFLDEDQLLSHEPVGNFVRTKEKKLEVKELEDIDMENEAETL